MNVLFWECKNWKYWKVRSVVQLEACSKRRINHLSVILIRSAKAVNLGTVKYTSRGIVYVKCGGFHSQNELSWAVFNSFLIE